HVPNLVARYRFGDGPSLLYNAHVDVVPTGDESAWKYPPFDAVIADGKVWGRGSGDDKASVTAQIMGAIALLRSGLGLAGEVAVNVCGDDETGGHNGAKYSVEHIDAVDDFVVEREQSRNRVCVCGRGGAGVTVTVIGKTDHAALPWNGVPAS